jgi:hypothetical protein
VERLLSLFSILGILPNDGLYYIPTLLVRHLVSGTIARIYTYGEIGRQFSVILIQIPPFFQFKDVCHPAYPDWIVCLWFGGLVTWPAYWISFMSIVIEWHHIISQVEGSGASELFIGWNRVFSFGFFLICFLFWYAIGVGLTIGITLSEIPATRYALGSYTLLSMLITLGMNIILVIFSIRFLWLISMKGHMTQNVFRVSFSKMVIWLVLGSIPMILVLIAISCCLLIGLDAFSLVAWLFFPHIAY